MPDQLNKPRVVLVAESRHIIKFFSKLLAEKFIVDVAEDAEAAWGFLLQQQSYALVISELKLSIDQFVLLERIRKASDNQLAITPLMLLVGEKDSDKDRELAFQSGATDYVNFPSSSAELITRVELRANLKTPDTADSANENQQQIAVGNLKQLTQAKAFNSLLKQELSFSHRHKSHVSVARLHVDKVKAILTGFDKSTATSVVKAVARIIVKTLRREDTLGYLGEADFCILYPATNGIGATTGLNRILKEISARKILISGKQFSVTLSGAIFSCIADDSTSIDQIHNQLSVSTDKAISEGGNQIINSTPGGDKRLFSIDRVLKLIEANKTDDLAEHAGPLVLAVLPLLDFADEKLDLGFKQVSNNLREQLEKKNGSSQ